MIGEAERGVTNAGGDRNAGRYGGEAGATDGCVLYIFKFFLVSFSFFFFPIAFFSTEHADRRDGMRRK